MKKERIDFLIKQLNHYSNIYYNSLSEQGISDSEWDKMFDEIVQLEKETGLIMSNSPTQNAGYAVLDDLKKIKHSTPLLSLGKTKSIEKLKEFLGDREGVLMFKLDGGTQVANYDTELTYLATRGSSSTNEGQDITHNASAIIGIPKALGGEHHIQVVGEGVMYKSKLEEINSTLTDDQQYKNARNLANATSSMLDSKRVAERDIRFIAFNTLEDNVFNGFKTKIDELAFLEEQGFVVVEHVLVSKDNLEAEVERMTKLRSALKYDIDGLVLAHNDIAYGKSLGKTSHHFNNAIAYKFEDEEAETVLRDIIVDIGKSGQISYVAEFDPVELCGTTVTRASLGNYSLISQLQLGIGDSILVRKANEIIPQVTENLTRSGTYDKVLTCPTCESELVHKGVHQFCINNGCSKQMIGRLVHFCSRDAMNIGGLSEETIKTLFNQGLLYGIEDLYILHELKDKLLKLDRFGEKKVNKILSEIENSKSKPLHNVLYGLSIPSVGRTASKEIAKSFKEMSNIFETASYANIYDLLGDCIAENFIAYLNNEDNVLTITKLMESELTMKEDVIEAIESSSITGLNFCVTGKVNKFKNRNELKAKIESLGGKNQSGVSKNTDYLLNNDFESTSGKNKKAKDLGVPIITEDQFIEMIGGL